MNRLLRDQRAPLSQSLAEIQRSLTDCRAGLAFLGDIFKHCSGLTMDEASAKGLGHILHGLTVDIDGTKADFQKLEQFVGASEGERVIDLDQMGSHGQA